MEWTKAFYTDVASGHTTLATLTVSRGYEKEQRPASNVSVYDPDSSSCVSLLFHTVPFRPPFE